MKRAWLALFTVSAAALLCMGAGWQSGRGGDNSYDKEKGGRARPRVVIKMRNYSVPHASPIRNQDHILRDNHHVTAPQRDERGAAIMQQRSRLPPAHHASVIRNQVLVRNITQRERVEVVPNRYYWHSDGRFRYCHYYDNGIHWYGFYHGPTFYWTRFYVGRWWWFDVSFGRWVYWWDGYWWWQGPDGDPYIYVQNNYYPYQEGVVTVANPEVQAAPAAVPAPTEGNTWLSPDGTRMVQIYGANSEAFLYDKTIDRPAYINYLGKEVLRIRFSGGQEGKPLRILLDFKDGSFALFDNNGNPMDAPPSAGSAAATAPSGTARTAPPAAPPTPEEIPPMPTSAPGEGSMPSSPSAQPGQ